MKKQKSKNLKTVVVKKRTCASRRNAAKSGLRNNKRRKIASSNSPKVLRQTIRRLFHLKNTAPRKFGANCSCFATARRFLLRKHSRLHRTRKRRQVYAPHSSLVSSRRNQTSVRMSAPALGA